MNFPRLSAVGALLTLTLWVGMSIAVRSQPAAKSSIQGVWRIVERTSTAATNYRTAGTNKQPQPGVYIFTGKHFSQTVVQSDKPRADLPDAAKATADQLRAAWDPFVGTAGTYEVSGANGITLRAIVTKDPAGTRQAAATTWSYKVDGNTLTMTQKTNQAGPIANPITLKFTRLE